MKKFIIILAFIISALGGQAQNRKQVSQFSLFSQYFNPGLTGFEGSQIKTFYRDQWVGFNDAPQTFLLSGELNLAELAPRPYSSQAWARQIEAKHLAGLAILRDTFGPFRETQFNMSYASRVRLNKELSLRAGAALTYHLNRLDAYEVTVDDLNDPEYQDLFGSDANRAHKLDVNIGLALTAQNFYVGYAVQDLAKGHLITGDNYYAKTFPLHHVLQAGYRTLLTEHFGVVVNSILRYDSRLKETLEAQVKGVYDNTFWVGAGYRNNLAITFNAGLRVNQLRLGYAREVTTGKAGGINAPTNEVMVTCRISPVNFGKIRETVTIW